MDRVGQAQGLPACRWGTGSGCRVDLHHPERSELWAACRYLDTAVDPGVRYDDDVESFRPTSSIGRFGPVSAQAAAVSLALRVRPNPGNGVMNLSLGLPRSGDVTLRVFDPTGREVAWNILAGLKAGVRQERWDVRDRLGYPLPSGSYYVRMEAPSGQKTARWLVLE